MTRKAVSYQKRTAQLLKMKKDLLFLVGAEFDRVRKIQGGVTVEWSCQEKETFECASMRTFGMGDSVQITISANKPR